MISGALQIAANDSGIYQDQRGRNSAIELSMSDRLLAGKTNMDEISRHELDAKLELIETRMDGRVKDIQHELATLAALNQRAIADSADARKEVRGWGIGLIIAVFTTAIGVVMGVWQIVTGVTQGTIAAFEVGRQSSPQHQKEISPPTSQSPPATKRDPKRQPPLPG